MLTVFGSGFLDVDSLSCLFTSDGSILSDYIVPALFVNATTTICQTPSSPAPISVNVSVSNDGQVIFYAIGIHRVQSLSDI